MASAQSDNPGYPGLSFSMKTLPIESSLKNALEAGLSRQTGELRERIAAQLVPDV